jgi:menaquinone-9 beta-reductase
MQTSSTYACAIVGGGIAGLSLAIQLADKGIETIVFEKNNYPFHKVCGEYISMESWNFLCSLGLPLADLNLPIINNLGISSEKGFMLNAELPLGGFGISRYSLDHYLFEIAKQKGVAVVENCTVLNVDTADIDTTTLNTTAGVFQATIVCGSFGKYTPTFAKGEKNKKTSPLNYIGVKYHIKTNLFPNRIELHNFKDGYCGVSKVDLDCYCLCYLTTSKNLAESNNDILTMEARVLHRNPFLKKYFTESEFVFDKPLVISNISFHKKTTYIRGIFLLGDAAGTITPLCGNGMSMGLRASNILAELLGAYFSKAITKQVLVDMYQEAWNNQFSMRIQVGYYLQGLFGKRNTTHAVLKTLDKLPSVTKKIISLTHGKPF